MNRFRVNPIEGFVLGALALVFCHSVYSLFFDFENLRAAPLGTGSQAVAMHWEPGSRSPASHATVFRSVDFKCDEGTAPAGSPSDVIAASKIRLTGPLCGSPSPSTKLLKTQVINSANKYAATVFTDLSSQKFSTDYIPLVTGRNPIHVEFTYQGGKTFSRDLALERN
jgi:hypothetical protein